MGSNANPGTLAQPGEDVQRLVDMLGPARARCFRGTAAHLPFAENVVIANKNASGGGGRPGCTLTSYPGEVAKLEAHWPSANWNHLITVSKLVLKTRAATGMSPSRQQRVFADNNVSGLRKITTCSGWVPRRTSPAYRTTLTHNRIHNCADGASGSATTDLLVEHNLIYDNTALGARPAQRQGDRDHLQRLRRNSGGFGGGLGRGRSDHRARRFSNSSPTSWNVSAS